eukprot:g12136.t1
MEDWSLSSGLSRARAGGIQSRDDPDMCFGIDELNKREAWHSALMCIARHSKRRVALSWPRLIENTRNTLTNSLLLEERKRPAEPASQRLSQRLPEMEEVWPDIPPRRCPARPNWRRSDSLSRVGAELVADKPEEVEAGVTQAEQAFSASNRSTFETSMPKSQYELSQLSQLAESGRRTRWGWSLCSSRN